jgi:hypothetical protein
MSNKAQTLAYFLASGLPDRVLGVLYQATESRSLLPQ